MHLRLCEVTQFGVRSVGSYACQSREAEGGMTLWIQWPKGVGLPDLGIGQEATCDVLLTRMPDSQGMGEECSGVSTPPPPKPNVRTFGLVIECCTDVREVMVMVKKNIRLAC